jgi:hypothetical protein
VLIRTGDTEEQGLFIIYGHHENHPSGFCLTSHNFWNLLLLMVLASFSKPLKLFLKNTVHTHYARNQTFSAMYEADLGTDFILLREWY